MYERDLIHVSSIPRQPDTCSSSALKVFRDCVSLFDLIPCQDLFQKSPLMSCVRVEMIEKGERFFERGSSALRAKLSIFATFVLKASLVEAEYFKKSHLSCLTIMARASS